MRTTKRALSLVLILLMLTALCGCGGGSKAPDLTGVWLGDIDLGSSMVEEIDNGIAEMDIGTDQLPSFGDYMDSLSCQIRMEFKSDGTYLQTIDESSVAAMKETLYAAMVSYYNEIIPIMLAEQLKAYGITIDLSTPGALESTLGMSLDEVIEMSLGSDMETFVSSIMDEYWEDAEKQFLSIQQEGKYKVEEGKLYFSDSPDHKVDSKIYHPFTYENGVLTLEKAVGTDAEGEYADLYPLVLRAA